MVNSFVNKGRNLLWKQHSSVISAAFVIMVSNLLSAFLGLYRSRLLVGNFFGSEVSKQALDSYWVAFRLPELAFQLFIIGALSAAFIPVFSKYKKKNEEDALKMAASMMNIVLLLFTFVSILIFIYATQFNALITGGNFTSEQIELAANLSRVMLVAQLLFAISNFMTGIIQSHKSFIIPAIAPAFYNLGIILGIILLTDVMGIYAAAVGVVIGAFLHFVIQLPLARKLGFRFQLSIDFKHPGIKEMVILMPPRVLAIGINQLELFASVFFATALASGSLTIINIAQQLMGAPIRIIAIPIAQALLPFLSQFAVEGKTEELRNTLVKSIHQVIFLTFPATAILIILRIPLVRLAYGAAEFPWGATTLTGKAVAILALPLFAHGCAYLLVRAFYALEDTATPFVMSLISAVIYIGGSYFAVYVLGSGVLGLAVSTSVAAVVNFGLLGVFLFRKIGWPSLSFTFVSPAKTLLATVIMAIGLWIPFRLIDEHVLDTSRSISVLILTVVVAGIGLLVYIGLAKLFRIEEFQMILQMFEKGRKLLKAKPISSEAIEPPSQSQDVNPV